MGARTRFLWAAVTAVVTWCGWAASAQAYVYWTNQGTNSIGRANLDGSGAVQKFITTLGTPRGVAVNDRYIYWADAGANSIGRANLDGSHPNPQFMYAKNPSGVALVGEHIYWTSAGSNTVARANLDGSNVMTSFMVLSRTYGLTTDGKRLWAASSSNYGSIWGGDLNNRPSGGFRLETGVTVETGPAADGEYLYWPSPHTASIGRSTHGGSTVNQSFITGASEPHGVAVDGHHVYWTNSLTNTIGRSKLDGTDVEQTFVTGASRPYMMAVDDGGPSMARMSPWPGAYFFAPQPVGTISRPGTLTIRNSGYGKLDIDSVRSDGDDFLIAGDDCSRASLEPGESCHITVRFVPTDAGPRYATLRVDSNDPSSPSLLSVGGEGVSGPAETGPASAAPATFSASAPERTATGTAATFRLITCTSSGRRCTQRVMTADTTFATTGTARASLNRRGVVYATGTATAKRLRLRARRPVAAGRYTLVLRHGKRVTARAPITLR
jgi:hypothetical protein